MKKHLLLILCALFISVSLGAQSKNNQHLKFMGIPINGSITNFQNKLIAKGFKYDKAGSMALESPTRIYKGLFAGETAQLFVYYDREQKFVYRVKVIIDRSEPEQIISLMDKYKHQLESKYNTNAHIGNHEEWLAYHLDLQNGMIDLYCCRNIYGAGVIKSILDTYSLHIDYFDKLNYKRHDDNNMNDL